MQIIMQKKVFESILRFYMKYLNTNYKYILFQNLKIQIQILKNGI